MKKEIADRWVAALRSGEYSQATGRLRAVPTDDIEAGKHDDAEGFCCLGVLCDLYDGDKFKWRGARFEGGAESETEVLPLGIQDWAGMRTRNGALSPDEGDSLTEINDGGADFSALAALIETDWEKL